MEEEFKKAPNFPIGNKKYICVEYPGNVKNVNRALETFGGEKAISQFYDALKKKQNEEGNSRFIKPIELKYRPKDPYCHPIEGNVVPTNRLLLKVTRRRKKNQPEEEAELKTDVLGVIPYTCRFRNMADFQYIVPKSNRMDQLRTSLIKGNVNNLMNYKPNIDNSDDNVDLEVTPPPLFSSINTPFKYDYKQNAFVVRIQVEQPDGSYVTKLVNKRLPAPKLITSIAFDAKDTPQKPQFELPPLDEDALVVKEKISKLFEKRPVWNRVALRAQLEPSERVHLLNVLLHISYNFSNGPWRECWVKYGIDVRSDVKYNIYQQMDTRLNMGNDRKTFRGQIRMMNSITIPDQEKLNKEMEENEIKYIFDGKDMITGTSLFQLCDISDPDFTCIINNPKYLLDTPIKTSGFYYDSVFRVLRSAMKKKLEQLMEKGHANRMKNLEVGLDQAIERDIAKMKMKTDPTVKLASTDEMDHDIIDSQDMIDSQDIINNDMGDDEEEDDDNVDDVNNQMDWD